MGVNDQKLEMLFVDDRQRGIGICKELITYGIDVNELPLMNRIQKHVDFMNIWVLKQ